MPIVELADELARFDIEPLPDAVSQAEAEAGSATTLRSWTAQRVRQAIAAWWAGAGRRVSVNEQSSAYTFALTDDVVTHPATDATARAWAIPDGFPVGALLTVDNQIGAGVITLSAASDVLEWVGAGTTGARTLAAGGQATLLKVGAARWRVGGVGLS